MLQQKIVIIFHRVSHQKRLTNIEKSKVREIKVKKVADKIKNNRKNNKLKIMEATLLCTKEVTAKIIYKKKSLTKFLLSLILI